ncbi:MAG: VWA domain-containing protein [Acidobacteriota bacterium]
MVRRTRTFLSAGAALLLLFGVQGRGQQPASQPPPPNQAPPADQPPANQAPPPANPPPDQTPLFRTGINFVRVDVIVSDRGGAPVADLKQSDFEVVEDGKPQAVETFKLIKLDGGAVPTGDTPIRQIRTDEDEQAEAAKDDVRLFAIFLDDYHVRRGASMTAGNPLARFVDTQLGPSDMIGVMRPLDSVDSVRMTRNHSIITRAIQQFRGRKFDYQPQNDFEQRYANYPAETVEQIRNQVSLSAMKALIVHMGGLKEGRKALIVVSEGYSNTLPPQLRDQIASIPGFGNPNRGNASAGENNPNEDRYRFFAGQDLEFYMQGVYEVASQNNVAIYTVDPRGLPAFEFDINEGVGTTVDASYLRSAQETLRALALETDGRAILNRNDLDVGMKQIVRDSSAYYLLGYTSPQLKTDGKFHSINVRVKRPGVQVRARKGYWAITPEVATAITTAATKPTVAPEIQAALSTVGQPARSRVVSTWIGTSRGENGKTRVTFVWEPIARAAGRDAANSEAPARISLMAIGPDGSPIFRGRVPDAAPAAAPPAANAGAGPTTPIAAARGSRVSFEAAPGKMQLRLSVEGSAAQVLDSEIRDITVPDLTAPQFLLGTPELFRARTARDFQLLKANAEAIPTVGREFSRTERVLVRVRAYTPGDAPAMLKARLLNRAGQAMMDLPVTDASAPPGPAQIELPMSNLPPGDYIIEMSAGDGDGAKELVGFRVTA